MPERLTTGDAAVGGLAPRGASWLMALGLCAWVLASVMSAATWEHQHDEGITFDIAIGALEPKATYLDLDLEAEFPTDPVPVAELYDLLDGDVGRSWGDIPAALRIPNRMPHPPLFYLAVHAWAGWFGTGTQTLRWPALLLGLAALLGVRLVARRLIPLPGSGEVALLLMALSPWFVNLSSFLRPYSLALCASIWATVAVLRLQSPGARRGPAVLLFVLASLVGLLSVYHYLFVFAWHGVLLCLVALTGPRRLRVRRVLEAALAGLVVLGGTSFWWPTLAEHLSDTSGGTHFFTMADPLAGAPMRLYGLLGQFSLSEAFLSSLGPDGPGARIWIWLGLITVTLSLAVVSFVRPTRGALDRIGALTWGSALLLPVGILSADLALGTGTVWVDKYGFGMFPLGVLLITRGWFCVGRNDLRMAGLVACAVLLASTQVKLLSDRQALTSGMERVAQVAAAEDAPGHVLVLSSLNRKYGIPLALTLRDQGVQSVRVLRCNQQRLLYLLNHLGQDPDVTRLTLVQFGVARRLGKPGDRTPVDEWPGQVVARLPELAQASGWRVTEINLQTNAESARGAGKPLTLLHKVVSKTFSGGFFKRVSGKAVP